MNLTTDQEVLLASVSRLNQLYRAAIRTVEPRVRAAIREEMRRYRDERDNAVRIAFDAGVPIKRIGEDGLQTTNRRTVHESLERTAQFTTAAPA